MRKWKPSKTQIEAFKNKLIEQDKQLTDLKNKYNNIIVDCYFNDNKSSLYLFLKNNNSYRISTHHLPSKNWEDKKIGIGEKYRKCIFTNNEIITNSRDNIIKKAINILENYKI